MARHDSGRVVVAALVGNVLVAATKTAAALITGSSAMLSEAVHTVADTGNELLLLYGLRRAARPPDADHPFGHGRELYFWSFVVALLVFALGAGVSIYESAMEIAGRDVRSFYADLTTGIELRRQIFACKALADLEVGFAHGLVVDALSLVHLNGPFATAGVGVQW